MLYTFLPCTAKLSWFLDGIPIKNADTTSHSESDDEVSYKHKLHRTPSNATRCIVLFINLFLLIMFRVEIKQ